MSAKGYHRILHFTAGSLGLVLEMVKTANKAGIDMITNLIAQIAVEGVIALEWEFRINVSY